MNTSEIAPIVLTAAIARAVTWKIEDSTAEWILQWCAVRVPLFDYPGLDGYDFPSGADALADLERMVAAWSDAKLRSTGRVTVGDMQRMEEALEAGTWLCESPDSFSPDSPKRAALAEAGLI